MWEFNIAQEQAFQGQEVRAFRGRWNRGDSQRSAKIRSLAGALATWGPEDSSAKMEIEGALKCAKAQDRAPPVSIQMPELVQPATKWRGWNKQWLFQHRKMLKRCQWKHRQIKAREAFIERARKRIEQFDVKRAAEVQRLEESQKRLEELRSGPWFASSQLHHRLSAAGSSRTVGRLSISKPKEGVRSRHGGGGHGVAVRPTGRLRPTGVELSMVSTMVR